MRFNQNEFSISTFSRGLIFQQRLYEAKFNDGGISEYSANLIAEALYSSTDEHGRTYNIITRIIDHRSNDNAIKKSEGWIELNDRKTKKVTTTGWELLVQWEDGSNSWIPLKDMKESNLLDVAEYAVANHIHYEPVFV